MARIVSYQALADATNDFDTANFVGYGGFGTVYRGELGGRVVAVKVLDAARGPWGVQEFQRDGSWGLAAHGGRPLRPLLPAAPGDAQERDPGLVKHLTLS